jgi:BON domain-containing protein
MDHDADRLPLPSEDSGDLADEPPEGMTDDPIVATEEGVPYDPPYDRVMSQVREGGGPDVAGTDEDPAGELEREDNIQLWDGELPRDDELRADVVETLRRSEVPAGDRIHVAVNGSQVILGGQVESINIARELVGMVGDVRGVSDVVDELEVAGV